MTATDVLPNNSSMPIPVNVAPIYGEPLLMVRLYGATVENINNLIQIESIHTECLDGKHEFTFYKTKSCVHFPNGVPYFDNAVCQVLSTPWYFTNTKPVNLREKILKMKNKTYTTARCVECQLRLSSYALSRLVTVYRNMDAKKHGITASDIINFVVLSYTKNISTLFNKKDKFDTRIRFGSAPIHPEFKTTELTDEEKKKNTTLIIHTDGASRNNGSDGDMAYAWTIRDANGNILEAAGKAGRKGTNNCAEYLALSYAIDEAAKYCNPKNTMLEVYSDSQLMVNQLDGYYRVNSPNLIGYYMEVKKQIKKFRHCCCEYTPRETQEIRYCDALCNWLLNEQYIREISGD